MTDVIKHAKSFDGNAIKGTRTNQKRIKHSTFPRLTCPASRKEKKGVKFFFSSLGSFLTECPCAPPASSRILSTPINNSPRAKSTVFPCGLIRNRNATVPKARDDATCCGRKRTHGRSDAKIGIYLPEMLGIKHMQSQTFSSHGGRADKSCHKTVAFSLSRARYMHGTLASRSRYVVTKEQQKRANVRHASCGKASRDVLAHCASALVGSKAKQKSRTNSKTDGLS